MDVHFHFTIKKAPGSFKEIYSTHCSFQMHKPVKKRGAVRIRTACPLYGKNIKKKHMGWRILETIPKMSHPLLYSDNKHKCRKNEKESEVKSGKHRYIIACLTGVMPNILTECNKARQGCNKRTRTSDIYTYQKICIIFREL